MLVKGGSSSFISRRNTHSIALKFNRCIKMLLPIRSNIGTVVYGFLKRWRAQCHSLGRREHLHMALTFDRWLHKRGAETPFRFTVYSIEYIYIYIYIHFCFVLLWLYYQSVVDLHVVFIDMLYIKFVSLMVSQLQGPLLLTWFNFNPNMDK